MRTQRLTKPLVAYRIGDSEGNYPVYSAQGAVENQGRWHYSGDAVIYASEHYATAMLEQLVHFHLEDVIPPEQFFVKITIPQGAKFEVAVAKKIKDWKAPDSQAARQFGHAWYEKNRSAVLIVPSVIAPVERNILINTNHPDFSRIKHSREESVRWDTRLFAMRPRARSR
ncbi:MAG: RES domain-containing protein [Gammaproteobacteria bacterium]|nr:RES domain-containing protein [Gammaproteobacteria bacterium]MDA7962671.1 RES domain-containing protein [Gammaproteobacteria bacterium]MDA7970501.1 RES domain-containing protein [Gammaproteobacteria bacterium]MDA7972507.1 RES domain-containing protein [Gammaproteobacteria bacterium]MDA8024296.1 RES domain-containing protein [Gammaproteobacteria bacterium]